MLQPHSPELQFHRKPPNFAMNSGQSQISSNPRLWLLGLFLLIQFLFIYITRNSPICFPERATAAAGAAVTENANIPNTTSHQDCPAGKVYVYNLPPEFNKDLVLHNCSDLNPWNWQCGIATNHGFGRPAAELRRVLPWSLAGSWYRTNQFSLEVIFHHRILNYKCRTRDPDSAAAFYIPFYAGLAVGKHLWNNDTALRDRRAAAALRWLAQHKQWRKSNGSDHFTAIGRITWDFRRLTDPDQIWGSTFLNMPEMQRVTRFIIEKSPADDHDVGVPYPTGFHPKDSKALIEWQRYARGHNRSKLFTFIGATRGWVSNDFRGILLRHCLNESSCRMVDCSAAECSTDTAVVVTAFLESEFCLQPIGDSFTRRSVFDCMLAGSVPVFFWTRTAYEQYEGFLPGEGEAESYSVFIEHEEVRAGNCTVKEVLMRYGKEEIARKREKIVESIIPRIIYGFGGIKDAFEIAVDGVLERIKEERGWNDFL
ncbi:xyloglucan galactosyltransferase XLT2-like [Andrographis paniculata]|uniref:xyloglucan galactosyltransferase XLT2-like n=1 Tax=Andrographis paniculata TaxID=175694 RepID=UPI0021E72785|nr:xyloglucan galactosyltransferase XLT2-like [Andrographis paniculata]